MLGLTQIEVPLEYDPTVYVYKRSSTWHWKFKLPNGKWFYGRAPGKDKKTVERNARKKERELGRGLFSVKEFDKIQDSCGVTLTFQQAIVEYIDHLKLEGRALGYYKWEKERLLCPQRFFLNHRRVQYIHKLTEEDAYAYRTFLLQRVHDGEFKRISAFGNLNSAKRFFKWLKKRRKISQNPWLEIDPIPVPKEERSRTVCPSADIVSRLLSAEYQHPLDFPTKEFAYGLYRTGARLKELLYLEVGDVDWETGTWLIRPKESVMLDEAKWSPKRGKKRVSIIPKDVLVMLRPLVQRALENPVVGYTRNKKGRRTPIEAKFIFTCIDRKLSRKKRKTVYRRVDTVRKTWDALFEAAGLLEPSKGASSAPFTRHDMRRGFNMAAKKAGMSLDDRALILGHDKFVNEGHYCGEHELDVQSMAKILNEKMQVNAS